MSSNAKSSASSSKNPAAAASAAAAAAKKSGSKDPSKPTKKKARRKKPPSSNKGPTSAQVMAGASRAQLEIGSTKALEAARRKDPLWYRTSEVLQAISADSAPVPGLLNEQVELVENALQQNHLTRADVTPQAFGVLLEQARRYALELVADAQDCAYAAHRHDITRADLQMALELRPDQHNMHTLGELQKMTVVSHNINKTPLPPIPQQCYSGIVLPPPPHQLTARTFDVLTGASVAQKMNQALPAVPAGKSSKSSSSSGNHASYGASRGRQIPIQLNASSSSTNNAGSGPMTGVTPSSSASSGIKRKAGEL